jgi:hypothetical protein
LSGGDLESKGGRARKSSGYLLVTVLLLVVALSGISRAYAAEEAEVEVDKKPKLMLVPRIGIGLEYGGLVVRRGDFSSAFRYRYLIDWLQFGRHLLYTDIEGEIDWGTPGLALAFNRVRHNISILGYRYDLGNYYVGGQIYHRCNNNFQGEGRLALSLHNRTVASTYYAGLELMDKAMLVAQEDRGIVFDAARPFEFLGRFHFAVNLNRVISRQDITNLNWLFIGRVRLDVLRFHNLIPYVEAGGEVLGQEQWNFVPRVETGVRFHWKTVEFTPFVQWGHTEEWLRYFYGGGVIKFESRSYLYAGGRLEFLLDRETMAQRSSLGERQWQFFSEVHGQGEYGLYVGSPYSMGAGGMNLNLDLIRWQHLNLFSNLMMHMDTAPNGLGPEKMLLAVDYGLRYDWPKIFLEGFVRHAVRLDGHRFHDGGESPNLVGARVGTQGMRLGHYDDGIDFEGPEQFQWLHKFDAQVSLAHYFNSIKWPCTWNVAAQARWDILRWRFIIPYVQGGLEFMDAHRQSRDVVEYYVEPGLRLHGVMDLAFFYRWQHRETIFTFKGPTENQNLVGIRVLF